MNVMATVSRYLLVAAVNGDAIQLLHRHRSTGALREKKLVHGAVGLKFLEDRHRCFVLLKIAGCAAAR